MGVRYIIGDLLTGRRIQNLPIIAGTGSWSEVLNDSGDIACTVSLKDPVIKRLGLYQSASVGKAFLAAISGSTVLNAGPIWFHDYTDDDQRLTLTASGMWSYFDHRVLLPVLAGRNPTDTTTDTRYSLPVTDPNATGYPWPTDTSASLHDIARGLVAQAQTWTNGNVPVVLPSAIAGSQERWYKGADLAFIGERLAQLTQVDGGPDIMFTPQLTSDLQGVQWVMRIGSPTEPRLFSPQRQKFQVGVSKSSVSKLRVKVDGTGLAAQAFASGGRTNDTTLISVSTDPTLGNAGYALLDDVDSSHSTVSDATTLQTYSDEIVMQGKTPSIVFAFDHDLSKQPFLEGFNAGDFADVGVRNNSYLPDDTYSMRIMSRSGDEQARKVSLTFYPEV